MPEANVARQIPHVPTTALVGYTPERLVSTHLAAFDQDTKAEDNAKPSAFGGKIVVAGGAIP